ncbi:hypothetical protein ParKJ_22605 [Paraburkholderia fungorum]|uniref:Uncharacterized protein n=1 Tax=Paraburkholderia fungorum TaxID=134537 RepID=A0AAP5QAM9_9BURK|nr:hypothetical protein [Paraburkholderia fungorum]MDT8840218.1 hypothetical protein [Paraburkholderia fungorum]
MSVPPSPQPSAGMLRALLNALVDQLPGGPVYASTGASQLPGWKPVPADCHGNADRWVAAHLGDVAVRGWLHEPFADLPHRFVAHSLVRTAAGALIDVTLSARPQSLRFLEHPGSDADFFSFLRCPLPFPVLAPPVAVVDEFLIVARDDSPNAEAAAAPYATGFPEDMA